MIIEPTYKWLKIKEAAEFLNMSRSSAVRRIKKMANDARYKNGIFRSGRIVRVREDILTKYLVMEGNK